MSADDGLWADYPGGVPIDVKTMADCKTRFGNVENFRGTGLRQDGLFGGEPAPEPKSMPAVTITIGAPLLPDGMTISTTCRAREAGHVATIMRCMAQEISKTPAELRRDLCALLERSA